jgi:hypothetical protein
LAARNWRRGIGGAELAARNWRRGIGGDYLGYLNQAHKSELNKESLFNRLKLVNYLFKKIVSAVLLMFFRLFSRERTQRSHRKRDTSESCPLMVSHDR